MIFRAIIFLLVTATFALSQQLERVWTDEKGRNMKASLIKVEDESAVLLMPDGRKIPYPIVKLSKTDQAFIEKFKLEKEEVKSGEVEKPADNFDAPWPEKISYDGDPEIALQGHAAVLRPDGFHGPRGIALGKDVGNGRGSGGGQLVHGRRRE